MITFFTIKSFKQTHNYLDIYIRISYLYIIINIANSIYMIWPPIVDFPASNKW